MGVGTAPALNEQPRVSVVVPTRNRRPYLRQLLDALAKQTLADHEVIVVDDGSTDGSSEEVEADIQAGRPVRLLQGGGRGAVSARVAAVDGARSELLAFTDDDCIPDPEWLAAGVRALEQGADVVQGVTKPHGAVRPLDRTIMVDRHDGLYNTCNVFYRPAAYRAVGGFPRADHALGFRPSRRAKNLGFGEDAMLGWRVRRQGRASFAPDAIVEHHVFAPDLRDAARRAWMTGAFPALVREIPELRDTALAHRYFLGTTRVPLYAAAALLALGRRRLATGAAAVWVVRHVRSAGTDVSVKRLVAGVPAQMGIDGIIAVALVVGSARARRIVL